MNNFLRWAPAAAAAAVLLAACGGGGDGDQAPRVQYGKIVSFGDSLSDVGSYATPGVVASGGGKYTVNGSSAKIWIERLAAQVGVAAPCAAEVGLESVPGTPVAGLAAPRSAKAGCFAYGQGGSRITNPIGVANAATFPADPNGAIGQLTVPVLTQINNHLGASGGSFAANDLVLLLAGGNDLFVQLATFGATVGGGGDPAAAGTAAVTAMGVAGAEMAGYVKALIVSRGAKRVVVVALPDVSLTPLGQSQQPGVQQLILQMSQVFNQQLVAGLQGTPEVLFVDAFKQSQDQYRNPGQYSVTNVQVPACNRTLAPTSLLCSSATLVAGDTSRYAFADDVHPTPYGYQLLAQFVAAKMAAAGWL